MTPFEVAARPANQKAAAARARCAAPKSTSTRRLARAFAVRLRSEARGGARIDLLASWPPSRACPNETARSRRFLERQAKRRERIHAPIEDSRDSGRATEGACSVAPAQRQVLACRAPALRHVRSGAPAQETNGYSAAQTHRHSMIPWPSSSSEPLLHDLAESAPLRRRDRRACGSISRAFRALEARRPLAQSVAPSPHLGIRIARTTVSNNSCARVTRGDADRDASRSRARRARRRATRAHPWAGCGRRGCVSAPRPTPIEPPSPHRARRSRRRAAAPLAIGCNGSLDLRAIDSPASGQAAAARVKAKQLRPRPSV